MSHKSKGINAERELIHMFWENGWPAVRVAGSGSSRYPSPDVLAGNGSRRLAIECKTTKDTAKYLTATEVNELQQFCQKFGAEPWVGIRFDKMNWYFLSIGELNQSGGSYSASVGMVKKKGLLFKELIE